MPNLYDREGNLVSVESPAQAEAMIRSGQFAPPPGKVQVQDKSGQVFDVDASEVHQALEHGLGIASPEAVHGAEVQEQFGGIGGGAASFGFHAADALGLNAATELLIQSKAKLHGVDPDVIREEIMGLREANPVSSGVGTAAGIAAPALFSGGAALGADAGILTKGLYGTGRVLTAPGRALGALGEGVGGAVGRVIGPEGAGFVSKLAARAGTMGATGATELGAYGGLATIGEASLGDDHELTAEKFWAGAGEGALVGLLAGGSLGAVSAGGSTVWKGAKDLMGGARGGARDVESIAARHFGESADGLGAAYSKASGALSGKDSEAIRNLTRLDAEGRQARSVAVFEGDAVRAEAARELRTDINQIEQSTRNLSPEWMDGKASNVAKTIARDEESVLRQRELAQNQLGAVRERLEMMKADPAAYGERAKLGRLERHVEVAERDVAKAIEAGKGEDVFVALDDLKKRTGPLAQLRKSQGVPIGTAADAEATAEIQRLYDGMRGTLTDAAWGQAGKMQADVNGAFEKWFQTKALFDERFMTKTGREGWVTTKGADPAKIDPYVNGLVSPRNDLTHSIIERHIEATKGLAQELAKAGELTPGKAAELAQIRSSAESFERTVKKAEKSLTLTNQLRELERTDNAAGAGVLGAVGGMLGGPLGALAGAAVGALNNPARVVRQLAAVERIAAKVDGRLRLGMKAFVHETEAVAVKEAPKGTVAERFAKESHAVRELAQNPALATERVTKSLAALNAVAPSVATQLAFKATRSAQMLAQMLPAGSSPGGIMQQFEKVRYSEADMQRWLRAKAVIEDPVGTMLEGMAKNHLSATDVLLVKENSPKLYAQMQELAMAEISNVKSPPTYQRKVMLGVLFGVPADATLTPEFMRMTQGAYLAMNQAASPGGGSAPGPARRRSSNANAPMGATASDTVEGR